MLTIQSQQPNAERARIHRAAYQGRRARVCLALGAGGLSLESPTAQWDALEITGEANNGYARVEWTIDNGSFDKDDVFRGGRVLAEFKATEGGLGYSFDCGYVVISSLSGSWEPNISQLFTFIENGAKTSEVLAPGQSLTLELFPSVMAPLQ